jgi:hypothetical protein
MISHDHLPTIVVNNNSKLVPISLHQILPRISIDIAGRLHGAAARQQPHCLDCPPIYNISPPPLTPVLIESSEILPQLQQLPALHTRISHQPAVARIPYLQPRKRTVSKVSSNSLRKSSDHLLLPSSSLRLQNRAQQSLLLSSPQLVKVDFYQLLPPSIRR